MADSEVSRVRIDKWLWAGAPDTLAAGPFAGRGTFGPPPEMHPL